MALIFLPVLIYYLFILPNFQVPTIVLNFVLFCLMTVTTSHTAADGSYFPPHPPAVFANIQE